MNPFSYPTGRHIRNQTPSPFADYRRFKPFLRTEFGRQCVYCRMPDGIQGEDHFGVDHYRPASKFPALRCDYANLFYSCNACNRRKGSFWPDDLETAQGLFIPNPCDHVMVEHLRFREAQVEALSPAGKLTEALLLLNDEEEISYRDFVLRLIERCLQDAELVAENILELERLKASAQEEERESILVSLRELREKLGLTQRDLERLTSLSFSP
jgi:hypothetical protein